MKDLGPFRGFSPETLVRPSPSRLAFLETRATKLELTLPQPLPSCLARRFPCFLSPLPSDLTPLSLSRTLETPTIRAPQTQRARIGYLQTLDSTFSLSVFSGVLKEDHENFDKEKYYGSQARAQGQYDFIKDVAQWIPDFVAVLSIHDVPTQFVSWNHLEELRVLDKEGECESSFLSMF